MKINTLIPLAPDEAAVLDSVDGNGWVRSADTATIDAMIERGLLFDHNTGRKLTYWGQQAQIMLRIARGELPAEFGREPRELPPLYGCDFHGNRQEHVISERFGTCYSASCAGRTVTCTGCGREFCRTPSETGAIEEQSPVVALDNGTLATLLEGGNCYATALDGARVFVRLMTPEEIVAAQHAAVDQADPAIRGSLMRTSIDQAVGMVRPAMPARR